MAQVCRVYKSEVPILIRVCYNNYNCQRHYCTYYEVLRISPNATQKEIKDAYIKLSKEMHPDAGDKGNHADFVKINEAYIALSKGKGKKNDVGFKYSRGHTTNAHYYHYHRSDNASNQWEEYTMRYAKEQNKKKYSENNRRETILYFVWFLIIGSMIQALHITTFLNINRHSTLQKSKQQQLEYMESLKEYQNKTMEQKLQRLNDLAKKYSMSTTDE